MNGNKLGDDETVIPDFLKRSEAQMTDTPVESVVETPKIKKPRKAISKGNGAAKPFKAAKAAPVKAKAASKPAKGKAVAAKPRGKRDAWGFMANSLKSQAAAMYASKKGATLDEVKAKLKSLQLNLLTKLEGEGFKVRKVKEEGPTGKRQVTRYFLSAK